MTATAAEGAFWRTHKDIEPRFLRSEVEFVECPVEASLGVLGKKWTIVILRDIGLYRVDRFHRLLRTLPGIPQKVLADRLKELASEGFLVRDEQKSTPPKIVRWSLTEKGFDAIRIGMMIGAFGSKWHADRVFPDRRPRSLWELYDAEGIEWLLREARPPAPRPRQLTRKFVAPS